MLRGKRTLLEFEVSNGGGVPADNLQILLPSAPWLSLVTPKQIGALAPGAKAKIAISLNPAADLVLGPYTGSLLVSGNNGSLSIGFLFRAVSDGLGDLKVNAQDEFSFFAEDHPNVAGAKVTLKDLGGTIIVEGVTDEMDLFETRRYRRSL